VAIPADLPMRLLCPYDVAALDPAVVTEARRSHPIIRSGEIDRRRLDYRGRDASAAPFDAPLPAPAARRRLNPCQPQG